MHMRAMNKEEIGCMRLALNYPNRSQHRLQACKKGASAVKQRLTYFLVYMHHDVGIPLGCKRGDSRQESGVFTPEILEMKHELSLPIYSLIHT